jgi:hypothetical protein
VANELTISYPTGNTLYSVILDLVGQIYNTVTTAFEAPVNANWANYDIAMAEAGNTGIYRGDMPAVAAGAYSFVVRDQAGGGPAITDPPVGAENFTWDGSVVVPTLTAAQIWAYATRTLTSFGTLVADIVTAILASALATNVTAILARLGAFTGTGVNTILGFLRAMMRKDTDTPSDVGGTYDDATDSLEAIRDTITAGSINVVSFVAGDTLNFVVGVTFDETLPASGSYTISATWSKMYFTLKRDADVETDAQAMIKIQATNGGAVGDGLIVLNGISSDLTAANASLTVNQAAGTIRLIVTDDALAELFELDGLAWDFKEITAAGASNVITQGNATISYTPTRAIT